MLGYLVKTFQKKSFKDWQLLIIKAALEGKNTLVIQPTGAGKSLCFQFPSIITKKMTVVVTPTISLMIDQVHRLKGYCLQATFLGSKKSRDRTPSCSKSSRRGLLHTRIVHYDHWKYSASFSKSCCSRKNRLGCNRRSSPTLFMVIV